ncbi:DEAD/DEAH box helicase [Pontibacterium sp. N1Y112]|uniref:DEAD-box ATP-dependent RNA helicase RhpA n=1 Tax=Pontibacterium sinense TaxID=2781979 RepID=A0A8J7FG07_9GAMM|nr:DEAD/DEAH box helicase [Pontibacterium sinense]MBE9399009.1 DEAD/DEAH box helicase [Pontibacterium sinense]
MSTFTSLGLSDALVQALDTLNYRKATPIQSQAIPEVLAGKDLMAEAQTGTGKTAAFALPILQMLDAQEMDADVRPPRALILVPTRELAVQVTDSFYNYGEHLGQRIIPVYGGVRVDNQIKRLKRGADIIVATPGRLLDLLEREIFSLDHVQTLVLDEADRMLDLGFSREIDKLMRQMPKQRQTLLFSATIADNIDELSHKILTKPVQISVTKRNSTAATVQQMAYRVDGHDKADTLSYMIQGGQWKQVLVFTRTKRRADILTAHLLEEGISAAAIHGDKGQRARTQALADFKQNKVRILVATDVAARGLDIDALPRVVNFDLPNVPEAYVHRIGRTGRAGSSGQAISLVAPDEKGYLAAIEALIKRPLKLKPVPFYEDGSTDPIETEDTPTRSRRQKPQKATAKPAKKLTAAQLARKKAEEEADRESDARPSLRPSFMSSPPKKKRK